MTSKLRNTGKQAKDFANALLIFQIPVTKYLGKKKKQPKKKAQHFPHMTLIQNPHKMAGQIAPYQADQVTYPKNNNQVALMLPKFLIWEELFQPQKHKIKREWFKEQTKRNCQHIGK